jgi:hypothetical protein
MAPVIRAGHEGVRKIAAMQPLDYFNEKAAREAAEQQAPVASTTDLTALLDFLGVVFDVIAAFILP